MKKLLIAILCMVALGVVKPLQAQITKDYESVFKSLSKSERVQFLADLRGIINGVQKGDELQIDLFEDLKAGLPTTNPTAGIDSILQAWETGRSIIQDLFSEIPGNDSETILKGLDRANAGWIENMTTLESGFDKYRDSMQIDPAALAEAEASYSASSIEAIDALSVQYQSYVDELLKTTNISNGRSIDQAANSFLNDFGDLEVGAGFQSLFASYYDEAPDSTTATLIRLGTAPNYNKLWGAEWEAWASFKINGNNPNGGENGGSAATGFQSLLAGGSVSFQYRPELPFTNGIMRLITGVGTTVQAYMPARINPNKPQSFNNKGKTTGIGPDVRLGFAVNTNKVNFYSYASSSKGYVARSSHLYNGFQAVTGIQWQALHVRLLHGSSSWAENQDRTAKYNEVSFNVRIK